MQAAQPQAIQIVLISGLSGSGKSVALRLLEDLGYYCIDNLPAYLLTETVRLLCNERHTRIGISIDARGAHSLPALPDYIAGLKVGGLNIQTLFFEASPDVLLKRFSETRRKHPLSVQRPYLTVAECIVLERDLLSEIADLAYRIDTTDLSANALRTYVKQFLSLDEFRLTLQFQSFGYKYGIPLDADYIFDVRCLPNPYYDPALRRLDGRDQPVMAFLEADAMANKMFADIERFLVEWLPLFDRDNRSYVTVGIGCTGGQHRSVWLSEKLYTRFHGERQVLLRHRELSGEVR